MKIDKTFWVTSMIFLVEACFALMLVSPESIRKQSVIEAVSVYETMGMNAATEVEERATRWYTTIFVEPEVEETLTHMFIPSNQERARSRGLEDFGSWLWPFMQDRIACFMDLSYWVCRRVSLMVTWIVPCLIALVAAVLCGRYRRLIKQTNFSKASGIKLMYMMKVCTMIVMLFFMAFIFPFALNPIFVPFILGGLMITLGMSIGHITKRL